jgi:putative flippase GtrA
MSSSAEFLRKFNSRDAHPFLQFVKYGIAGGIATAVHMAVFFLAAWLLFPALTPNDPFVQLLARFGAAIPTPELADSVRSNHVMVDNAIAFLFSNAVAYVVNILWVFRPGRHGRTKEMLLFFAASALSMVAGTALAGGLVRWTGMATTYAFAANIVASVLINYAARKFLIFKG